jgi:flagellar biogenesis protein FliO
MTAILTNPMALVKTVVVLQPGIVAALVLFEERASITKVVMQGSDFAKLFSYVGTALLVFLVQIWCLRAVARPGPPAIDIVPQLLYFLGIVMGANAAIVLNADLNSPTLVIAYLYSAVTLFWASFQSTHEHATKRRKSEYAQ